MRARDLLAIGSGLSVAASVFLIYRSLDQADAGHERAYAEVEFKQLDGRAAKLEGYRGAVVLLVYFAEWCGPCNTEAPLLEREFWERYRSRGLQVVGISIDSEVGAAALFQRRHGLTFPIWMDSTPSSYWRWNSGGLLPAFGGQAHGGAVVTPYHVVLDAKAATRYRRTGFDAPGLHRAVQEALRDAGEQRVLWRRFAIAGAG